MLNMLYHHLHKISKRHSTLLALALISLAVFAFMFPKMIFAAGVFGGRIKSVSPEPNTPCIRRFNISPAVGSPTICQASGLITEIRPCKPNAHIIGFGTATVIRAWCG